MVNRSKKRRFYDWLTNKYQFIIRNEENFEETTSVSFNYVKAFSILFITFVCFLFLSLFIAKFLLAQWYDPEYGERKLKKEVRDVAIHIDSLEIELNKRNQFIQVFKMMLEGGEVLDESDSVSHTVSDYKSLKVETLSEIDKKFREQYQNEDFVTNPTTEGEVAILQSHYFPPVEVFEISQKFSSKKGHFGIDLTASPKSSVQAITNGAVLVSTWTPEDGNVIVLQHKNNLITVYKHNETLLKKVGSFVKAGDAIAIIGSTGEKSSGPHLHFEMWYNGKPVNPEHFIAF